MFFLPPPIVVGFSSARAWTLGYGDKPRIPLVADIEGNGTSAIVSVNPAGDGSIDVDLGTDGLKASGGITALTSFGKDCQAAVAGKIGGEKSASVIGLFADGRLGLASNFSSKKFQNQPHWMNLPRPLSKPKLALIAEGSRLLAYSSITGKGYEIDLAKKSVRPLTMPKGLTWIGDEGENLVAQKMDGEIFWLDPNSFKLKSEIGRQSADSLPSAAPGLVAFEGHVWTPKGLIALSKSSYPPASETLALGSVDQSGRPALFEFRNGNEYHRGGLILKRRAQLDSDSTEAKDWEDSSNDGLLDGWKRIGFRGLDLKSLGCTTGHADVICLVSRFDDVSQTTVDSEMKRIVKFYADLKVTNPDGTTGIRFHPIFLDPVTGADKNNPWWVNRDKFLPAKWRGVVHWMQITRGGGGQADELSNGGTCGEGALWAVFVHEFGHQLGLNHEGFCPVGASPVYTSLMNYTWSYGFEESRDKIHYSDGLFENLKLHENDLDETLPYPYDKVKFLSMAPYHFRMKPDGNNTLIDWNWNGVFGEKHVKATINYAYSTSAGTRDTVAKTKCAPWIFTQGKNAYVLYGTNDLPVDLKVQPTLSLTRPGRLLLKKLVAPTKWEKETIITADGLMGDPVAAAVGNQICFAYPSSSGLQVRFGRTGAPNLKLTSPQMLSPDSTLAPTIGAYKGRCYLFDWNPISHQVGYRSISGASKISPRKILNVASSNPVGLVTDPISGDAIIGLAQDQGGKSNRWQIRHYLVDRTGSFVQKGEPEWVEGEKGGSRGTGRITLLFDSSKDAGPKGRVYLYGKGMTDEKSPWACTYVAQQIADKSYNGGWIVKRFYDEWSQTRSAPAAAWFNSDILFAYRWTAGDQSETDNNLHLGYHGLGIEGGELSDFNDLAYIRNFGLANSILNLSPQS